MQLRALEAGILIHVTVTDYHNIGIGSREYLLQVESYRLSNYISSKDLFNKE